MFDKKSFLSIPKHSQHVGNNDHDVTCQYVWKTDDLTCRWNTNRQMAHFQECCKVWGFQGEQGEDPASNLGVDFFLLKGFDLQEMFRSQLWHQAFINEYYPNKFVQAWSSGCWRKTESKFGFSVRHSRSSIWGMRRNTGWESRRAACHASPLNSDLGGEICFEPRPDAAWCCQEGRQNRDGAVSSEFACQGSQTMVLIVFRVGASWI